MEANPSISLLSSSQLKQASHSIHRGTCEVLQQAILAEACRVVLALHFVESHRPAGGNRSRPNPERAFNVDALSLVHEGLIAGEAAPFFSSMAEVKQCFASAPRFSLLTAAHVLRCPDFCMHRFRKPREEELPHVDAVNGLLRSEASKAFCAEALLLLTEWLLKDRGEEEQLLKAALEVSPYNGGQRGSEGTAFTRLQHMRRRIVVTRDTLYDVFPELLLSPDERGEGVGASSTAGGDITCGCRHRWFCEDLPRWLLRGALLEHSQVWYDVAVMGRAFNRWCLRRGLRVLSRMAEGKGEKDSLRMQHTQRPRQLNHQHHRRPREEATVLPAREEERATSPPTADCATRGPSETSVHEDAHEEPQCNTQGEEQEEQEGEQEGVAPITDASSIASVPSLLSEAPPSQAAPMAGTSGCTNRLEDALSGVAVAARASTPPLPPPPPSPPAADNDDDDNRADVGRREEELLSAAQTGRLRRLFLRWRDGRYYRSIAARYVHTLAAEHRKRHCWKDWVAKTRERMRRLKEERSLRVCEDVLRRRAAEQVVRTFRLWRDAVAVRQMLRKTLGARAFDCWKAAFALLNYRRRRTGALVLYEHRAGDPSGVDGCAQRRMVFATSSLRPREALQHCFTTWRSRFVNQRADAFYCRSLRVHVLHCLRAAAAHREQLWAMHAKAHAFELLLVFRRWKCAMRCHHALAVFQSFHSERRMGERAFAHWQRRTRRRRALDAIQRAFHEAQKGRIARSCFYYWVKRQQLQRTYDVHGRLSKEGLLQNSWRRWKERAARRGLWTADQLAFAEKVYLRGLLRRTVRQWHRQLLSRRQAQAKESQEQQEEAAAQLEQRRVFARVFYHWRTKAYLLASRNVDARRVLPVAAVQREAQAMQQWQGAATASSDPHGVVAPAMAKVPQGETPSRAPSGTARPARAARQPGSTDSRSDTAPHAVTARPSPPQAHGELSKQQTPLFTVVPDHRRRRTRDTGEGRSSALQAERNYLLCQSQKSTLVAVAVTRRPIVPSLRDLFWSTAAASASATPPPESNAPSATLEWANDKNRRADDVIMPGALSSARPESVVTQTTFGKEDEGEHTAEVPTSSTPPPPPPPQRGGALSPAGLNVSYETQVKKKKAVAVPPSSTSPYAPKMPRKDGKSTVVSHSWR